MGFIDKSRPMNTLSFIVFEFRLQARGLALSEFHGGCFSRFIVFIACLPGIAVPLGMTGLSRMGCGIKRLAEKSFRFLFFTFVSKTSAEWEKYGKRFSLRPESRRC